MSRVLMPRTLMGGQGADIALQTIVSKGTPAFYLPDPDPALRMPSGLRRGYQDFSNTPVTAATQTAALALDLSEGAAIGAELISGDYTDYWSDVGNVDVQANQIVATSSSNEQFLDADLLTEGAFYLISFDITDPGVDSVRFRAGSQTANDALITSAGTYTYLLRADGTYLGWRTGTSAQTFTISNISVRPISGYHFYQATSADEPTLNLTNGLYGYLGDGVSKGFRNSLAPNANPTLLAAFEAGAVSDIITGCQVGTNKFELGLNGDGKLIANIGTTTAIVTANSIVDVPGVAALSASGSDYFAAWYPISGTNEIDSGNSFSGSIPTTQGVYSLQTNDDGSGASFADALMLRNLMQRSQWSQAQIEAVAANQWRSQLQALAA